MLPMNVTRFVRNGISMFLWLILGLMSSRSVDATELVQAILRNDAAAVRVALLHEEDPNSPGFSGYTPLHLAVVRNLPEVVAILLEDDRVDIGVLDVSGNSPLGVAIHRVEYETVPSSSLAIMEMLFSKGAEPDYFDPRSVMRVPYTDLRGNSLLHFAVSSGKRQFVERILQRTPSLANVSNKNGQMPKTLARKGKFPEIVELIKASKVWLLTRNLRNEFALNPPSREAFMRENTPAVIEISEFLRSPSVSKKIMRAVKEWAKNFQGCAVSSLESCQNQVVGFFEILSVALREESSSRFRMFFQGLEKEFAQVFVGEEQFVKEQLLYFLFLRVIQPTLISEIGNHKHRESILIVHKLIHRFIEGNTEDKGNKMEAFENFILKQSYLGAIADAALDEVYSALHE